MKIIKKATSGVTPPTAGVSFTLIDGTEHNGSAFSIAADTTLYNFIAVSVSWQRGMKPEKLIIIPKKTGAAEAYCMPVGYDFVTDTYIGQAMRNITFTDTTIAFGATTEAKVKISSGAHTVTANNTSACYVTAIYGIKI